MRVLVGVLVLLTCAWQTHTRSQDWRSDEALWQSAVREAPSRVRPALNLARVYLRQGEWDQATVWLLRAQDNFSPRDAWTRPHLCLHIARLMVMAPEPPSFSLECAS